jgi:hypothetical protein
MLANTLAAGALCYQARRPEILAEPHLLSEESAAQFHTLFDHSKLLPRKLIVLPAARRVTAALARDLHTRARSGAWIVLESGLCFATDPIREQQTRLWTEAFGLRFSPVQRPGELFVEYVWPVRQMIRGFEGCTPLGSPVGKIVAQSAGKSVCCLQRIGQGGIVFLGAMLGPGLAAGELEAWQIGLSMVESIARLPSQ